MKTHTIRKHGQNANAKIVTFTKSFWEVISASHPYAVALTLEKFKRDAEVLHGLEVSYNSDQEAELAERLRRWEEWEVQLESDLFRIRMIFKEGLISQASFPLEECLQVAEKFCFMIEAQQVTDDGAQIKREPKGKVGG